MSFSKVKTYFKTNQSFSTLRISVRCVRILYILLIINIIKRTHYHKKENICSFSVHTLCAPKCAHINICAHYLFAVIVIKSTKYKICTQNHIIKLIIFIVNLFQDKAQTPLPDFREGSGGGFEKHTFFFLALHIKTKSIYLSLNKKPVYFSFKYRS